MNRAAVYIRVSTEKQAEEDKASLGEQGKGIRAFMNDDAPGSVVLSDAGMKFADQIADIMFGTGWDHRGNQTGNGSYPVDEKGPM